MAASGPTVQVLGVPEAEAALARMPPHVQGALRIAVAQKTIDLRDGVKAMIKQIFRSDGPLYKSVQATLTEKPGSVTGVVFTDDSVAYAAAQEYGVVTSAHDIFPVHAQALAFMGKAGSYAPGVGSDWKMRFSGGDMNTQLIIAKAVHHPGSRIPERSYARRTLFGMRQEIRAAIASAVEGAI